MLKLLTASTISLLGITETKNYLRVNSSEDDDLINALIKSSVNTVEDHTGLVTNAEGWQQTHPGGVDEIELLMGPVSSVESITYYDDFDSTGKLLTESTDFRVTGQFLVHEDGHWEEQRAHDGYIINYTVGGNWDSDDKRLQSLKTCALRLTGWLYENREEYVTQINDMFGVSYQYGQLPEGIKRLLNSFSEDVGF